MNSTYVCLFLAKIVCIHQVLIMPKIFSSYRETLKKFLMSTKCSSGAFSLEVNGEVDIRGAYCAAAVATVTNLNTEPLFEKTTAWILRCLDNSDPLTTCRRMNEIDSYF